MLCPAGSAQRTKYESVERPAAEFRRPFPDESPVADERPLIALSPLMADRPLIAVNPLSDDSAGDSVSWTFSSTLGAAQLATADAAIAATAARRGDGVFIFIDGLSQSPRRFDSHKERAGFQWESR